MKMKTRMIMAVLWVVMLVVVMFAFAQPAFAAGGVTTSTQPTDDLRRQLYELNALMRTVSMEVNLYNQDNSWHSSGAASFTGDVAFLKMDVTPGPGFYRGYAGWNDKWGNPLFSSMDCKLVLFKAGVNLKDFPVYLNGSTVIHQKIEGPSSGDGVWVNGQQAWFSDGYWHANIDQPWLVDTLDIIWSGHGGWKMSVSPTFAFDSVIQLTGASMDPTNDIVAQMAAVSYPGEDSWVWDVAGYESIDNDSNGNQVAKLVTSIPYGTKILVFLSYYDQNLGSIEYFGTAVTVTDKLADGLVILIPLAGTWFSESQTQIRLVYTDASGTVRQTWVPYPTSPAKGG